ncbi:DUF4382 domain-containing protein [Vulgatibacter incomptus]|uniref:DUF4382 domain-containing protein n=1 Tax=Vulgatibacter incomptus TaxID=1391653 RepID=A0A0K1PJ43_9BACT|nr:DUF4382 domain-containing protein [Vulgatibacter incomptus]AKU93124.1 hypothetical protein AKJ08_3511 [Vulgatibacter incomptus]
MRFRPLPLLALVLPLLAACGDDMARVRIVAGEVHDQKALASRKPSEFDAIVVNVISVSVHVSGEGWYELLNYRDLPLALDLRKLLNGEQIRLADDWVPPGKLTQVRLILDKRAPGYATPVGSPYTRIPLNVPSGTTSGLKISGKPIVLEEGKTRELRVEFDVRASLKDDADGLRLRPVIQLRGVKTQAFWD